MIANPIPWPNGARCACAITFDMDADSLIHISRPADSHQRLYPTSMGRYGPTVGVPRILETYRKFGLKQSFFIPGWCIEVSRRSGGDGCRPAAIVLNDVPMAFPDQIIRDLDPNIIQRIEVLSPVDAQFQFGSAAGNGAILIYTRR